MKAALLAAAVVLSAAPQLRHSKLPDVKYVPTPQNVVEEMLRMARVTSADIVWDLGSGDGRIPITAAQLYGARGFGVEIDHRLVLLARENELLRGQLADHAETIRDLRARLDAEAEERRRVQERLTGLLTHRQGGSVPAVQKGPIEPPAPWWRRWFR